jgi:hypothetical protein
VLGTDRRMRRPGGDAGVRVQRRHGAGAGVARTVMSVAVTPLLLLARPATQEDPSVTWSVRAGMAA